MIRVVVAGAAGRMGEAVCEAVDGADDMTLAGKADPDGDPEGVREDAVGRIKNRE